MKPPRSVRSLRPGPARGPFVDLEAIARPGAAWQEAT